MEREDYMRMALQECEKCAESGDVPVGCVIVKDGKVIGTGRNRREARGDATAHAEVEAIRQACEAAGSWRLHGAQLYVTLEPCPMCAGAIINSRIDTVCFGAKDEKAGSCGTVIDLFMERYNHRPKVYAGILEKECADVLRGFFSGLRDEEQPRKEKSEK